MHACRWAIWTGSHFDPGSSTWHWPGKIWFGDDRGWTVCDHSCNLTDSLANKSPWESFLLQLFIGKAHQKLWETTPRIWVELPFFQAFLLVLFKCDIKKSYFHRMGDPFFLMGWKSFGEGRRAAGKWRVDCAGCEARMGRCDVMMSCYHHRR